MTLAWYEEGAPRQKTKFFVVNYLIGTIQFLALATIDLHPKGAFSSPYRYNKTQKLDRLECLKLKVNKRLAFYVLTYFNHN